LQDVNDLRQRLVDLCAGVEQSIIDNAINQRQSSPCLPSSHRRTFWILTVTQISQKRLN